MTDTFLGSMILSERYKISERVGTGGMARVFKAHDTNLDRPVAIKILHDHLASDATFKERFEREAKFIASLNHPNIVQIYDFNVVESAAGSLYYMVMPFIPGKTLRDILEALAEQSRRLPVDRALEIFKDICDALSYAHKRGMIHRDVKPANILFDEHDRAVLTDFGIARLAEGSSLTQDGVTTGTPSYMSPEQVGGGPVDMRSDVYALGIILFEMLAGTVPYADESAVSTMLKHIQAPVPIMSDYLAEANPALDAVIGRALAKHPDDRFPSVDDFCHHASSVLTLGQSSPLAARSLPPSTKSMNTGAATAILSTQESQPAPVHTAGSQRKILLLGGGVLAALLLIALISRAIMPASPITQEDAETVPGMTSDNPDYLASTFDTGDSSNELWPQGSTGALVREITADGYYRFENLRPGTAATSIIETSGDYYDSIITLEGLLESTSQSASGYGIIFRHVDAQNYYVFAIDGERRFSIWIRENGEWRELRDQAETWTFHEAIQSRGTANTLSLMVHGNHFVGSVNGVEVTDIVDNTLSQGKVGIYLATPGSGNASLLVDSLSIDTNISAPSMTADS